jgi:DNA-binding NarL/FixJ family response regulator
MIRIGIVDDHPLFINGIKEAVATFEGIELIALSPSAHEVRLAVSQHLPDVLLLDLNLPDADGVDLCRELRSQYPTLQIIALTTHHQHAMVKILLGNGASGYLLKTVSITELEEAIHTVHAGKVYLQSTLRDVLLNESLGQLTQNDYNQVMLTRREKEVLRFIVEEYTSQEIADKLFLSVKTIETHRLNLVQKLGVRNTAGLVRVALSKGLI